MFTQPTQYGPLTGAAASSALLKVNDGWKRAVAVGGSCGGGGGGNGLSAQQQDSSDKPVADLRPSAPVFLAQSNEGAKWNV